MSTNVPLIRVAITRTAATVEVFPVVDRSHYVSAILGIEKLKFKVFFILFSVVQIALARIQPIHRTVDGNFLVSRRIEKVD